jgi:hypothetical protein
MVTFRTRGVDCCGLLTGVRDVCCRIPVSSVVSDLHMSLGTAEQEGSSFLEGETEQHEPPALRNFQERSVRALPQRSTEDVESKEITDETVINITICCDLNYWKREKWRNHGRSRHLNFDWLYTSMFVAYESQHWQLRFAHITSNIRRPYN